jgi:hypothetical protein
MVESSATAREETDVWAVFIIIAVLSCCVALSM